MMLTFHLSGQCLECGGEVHGIQMSWPERINLGSIVTKHSLTFWKADCHPNAEAVRWDGRMRLDDESEALVEKARDKIRARRKQAA
jgi:hypothetical protein